MSPFNKGGYKGINEGAKEGLAGDTTCGITKRAIYRFFRDAGDSGIDVLLLSIADAMATQPQASASEAVSYKTVAEVARRILDYYY
ncbi:MAG: hypothetical protein HZC10_08920, partial [Nitrospirae bacterium]|nr:hypothetical protein [Nitrospirota bacterium]